MTLFLLQFAGEVKKLFARKRTYFGFAAFVFIEIALILLLQRPKIQKSVINMLENNGYINGQHYYSGLTLAFMVLVFAVMLLGALYLALVAGDIVSKEIEDGTMRMMLCRPISRFRLLVVKYLACMLYTAVLTAFIAGSALLVGLLYRGPGGLFVYAPEQSVFAVYEFGEGLARYWLSIPLLALSLATITSLGFLFSCLRMKPSAATILTLTIMFVDFILHKMPFLESVRTYFLNDRMAQWVRVFEYQYSWAALAEGYLWLIAIQLSAFTLAWLAIEFLDFKN